MKINNIDNLTAEQINYYLENGGKFVVFQYCFSLLFVTFKRHSNIYFIKSDENPLKFSYSFIILSLLFGWWGIPWGPIYTIQSLYKDFGGGTDVTQDVLQILNYE